MSTRTTKRTFAAELKHFVESVDIVDDQVFMDVREIVWKYLKDQLAAEYFELMTRTSMSVQTTLKAHWSSRDDFSWRIGGENGDTNPMTVAFQRKKPLWLVSPSQSPLSEAAQVTDEWSGLADLPSYEPFVDRAIKTAVVVPLAPNPHNPSNGLYFLETSQRVSITEVAKEELQMLAETLRIVMDLNSFNRTTSRLTQGAIQDLRERLASAEFPKLAKPHLFFAFSQRADRGVVGIVKSVLDEFKAKLDVSSWDEMRGSGSIPRQITHSISRSRFGICYLSEPSDPPPPEGPRKYFDNPNVVFESGMLQAQTNDYAADDEPTGWIPIREQNSPQAPFDFASDRIVYVPRNRNGEVDKATLTHEVRQRVKSLLRED